MKYFGKKSFSSVLSVIFHIAWYFLLVFSIAAIAAGIFMAFFVAPFEQFINSHFSCFHANFNDKDWQEFKKIPLYLKFIFMPFVISYFIAITVLMLKILKKSRLLFNNFKNDILFNKGNVIIISKVSRMLIVYSILTFNFSSLIIGILLLIVCAIFKNGTALQEEQDLTV